MNRLQSYYEQLQVPVKSLFFGSFLLAIGSILSNPYINTILQLDQEIIITVAQLLMTCGGIILSYFPIYVFVKLLSHQKDEPNAVVVGIISYITFLMAMTVLSQPGAQDAAYVEGIVFYAWGKEYHLYETGIFGLLAVFILVSYIFRRRKSKPKVATASSADRDTMRMVYAIFGSIVLGGIFAYAWPYLLKSLYSIMDFISTDVNNPMSLFAYGVLERVLALTDLSNVLHREFWLGSHGGSWMNLAGESFVGDVYIWMGQMAETVNTFGAGRFTGGYYVLNIFAIPGYLFALLSTISNKKLRSVNIPIIIGAVIVSMVSGILLPIELVMVLTSPTLYFFHLFMTGTIYAVLSGFGVALGFSYHNSLLTSTPGNIIDLVGVMQGGVLWNKIMILLLLGIIVFIIYFTVTRLYFSTIALDVLNISNKKERIESFADGLGGFENIEEISSTLTRIHVTVVNREDLNVSGLHRLGVTRIVETRQGYIVSIGSAAYMIQRAINKELKKNKAVVASKEVEINE